MHGQPVHAIYVGRLLCASGICVFAGLTLIYLIVKGPDAWKRYKVEDVYAMD